MTASNPRLQPQVVEEATTWCLHLAEGRLTPDQEREFAGWLEADPSHRDAFERAASVWQAFDTHASAPELIGIRGEALATVRQIHKARWAGASFLSRRWRVGVAASLILAAAGVGLWMHLTPHAYETSVGERQTTTLSDGSNVSLDADSRLDVRFDGERRRLWLERGRARFSVAHDPLRPFTVETGGKLIVATGTEFSVERLGDQVRVVLYEGRVSVLDEKRGERSPTPVRVGSGHVPADNALTPGHELVTSGAAVEAKLTATDLAQPRAWESGQLVFSDESLAAAVARVNRYSQSKLQVADEAASIPVSGVFTAGDVRAFVDGITAVFPVKARVANGSTILTLNPERIRPNARSE